MKIEKDEVTWSTGRVESGVNRGIVGINPNLEVSSGLDSGFGFLSPWDISGVLTEVERDELADYMIELWKQFKLVPISQIR